MKEFGEYTDRIMELCDLIQKLENCGADTDLPYHALGKLFYKTICDIYDKNEKS